MKKSMNSYMPIIIIIIVLLLILVAVIGIKKSKESNGKEELLNINYNIDKNDTNLKYETDNPVVAMYIENYGSVVIELYPNIARNTVNNFISLVREGYYDNNTCHRLVPGFVLQGGDRTGSGTGGPGYTIKGEFTSNGFPNNLKHEKGVVSMARANNPDSAGSQFFIMLGTAQSLDGNYAAFGRVIDGMDTVDRIAANERVANQETGKLARNLTIKKTVIDLNAYTPQQVEKVS